MLWRGSAEWVTTFFISPLSEFREGIEGCNKGCNHAVVQSYPESKAREISDLLIQKVQENSYSIFDLSFKELDMDWGLFLITKPSPTT
jgi:hypothetical protein